MAATALLFLSKLVLLSSFITILDAHKEIDGQLRKLEAFKASIFRRDSRPPSPLPSPSPSSPNNSSLPSPSPSPPRTNPRLFLVTQFGADPTCQEDSTQAILDAISAAVQGVSHGSLIEGIADLGGVQVSLGGGCYRIRRPLQLPAAGVGNLMIYGGTIRASDDFPEDRYLIDLSASSSSASYNFEYITMRDLMLDCNYRGGAISVVNSLRTSIDNCYITHFATTGIMVQSGHETYIRNSFLGQHITAGGDHGERNFSGTAINLMGNDNAVTDVVIFSAAVGVMISGQANTLSGVHCYNKATGFGGTGIYLKLPGLTQTRIVNCYMDFTGIVAEDPVQLDISNSFFLGDAYISLKSVNGVANGVTIVNNMFSGSDKGVEIVQLDGRFTRVGQVLVDGNNVRGMTMRSTVARASVQGNGTTWTVDFNPVLLFPNLIKHVQYSLSARGGGFPNHALRNVSDNKVVVEADREVPASVFMTVDQGMPN